MVQSPTLIMSGTSLRPTTAGGREEGDEYSEDDCLVEANRQSIKRNTSDDDGNVRPKNASPCLSAGRCVDNCAAYGRVCPRAACLAAVFAEKEIARMKEGSAIYGSATTTTCTAGTSIAPDDRTMFSEEVSCDDDTNSVSGSTLQPCSVADQGLPYLDANDIVIGDLLGEGGYCNVNLCTIKNGQEAGQTFAIKYLKRKTMADLHQFKHGAADLALEAHFLDVLDHPHIVKLHGVTAGSVESAVASGKECGFFIVVDKLVDTLEQRIARWHEEEKAQEGNHFFRFSSSYRQKKQAILYARLKIALDIADALAYMHSKGVIFRDLKPDNIGFDENDVLKLFDFGLVKELKPGQKKADGKYELTGNTGSRRYMANEVARGLNYDQSVDVFSFGVLLWEMCTTEKPYQGYSSGKHMNLVVLGGERPKMDGSHTMYWPSGLHQLITRCWSADCDKRPSFAEVKVLLNDIMDELCGPSSSPVSSPSSGGGRLMVPSPPPGAFSLLAPLSPLRKGRGKTTGGSSSAEGLPKEVKSIKPLSKVSGVRSRSWGFGPK